MAWNSIGACGKISALPDPWKRILPGEITASFSRKTAARPSATPGTAAPFLPLKHQPMTGEKVKRCLWLFWINLFIGAFTFGGGYIVVPMISKYFVRKRRLFSKEELLSMAAIAQSAPGAIAVNLSALAGHRTAGMAGVVSSCLGAVIPPLIILSIVSVWYDAFSSNPAVEAVLRGMQAGVAALIVDIVADMWRMILRRKSILLNALMPGAFLASFVFHLNIAAILAVCCVLSLWHVRRTLGRRAG